METNIQLLIDYLENDFLNNCNTEGQFLRGKIILDIVLRNQTPNNFNAIDIPFEVTISKNGMIESLLVLYLVQIHQKNVIDFSEINETIFELVILKIKEGQLGFDDGTGAILNYFNCLLERGLVSAHYLENILEALDNVLDVEYKNYMSKEFQNNFKNINNDFSLESGKTGLLLVLLDLISSNKFEKRIFNIVRRLQVFLESQIDYLVQHILPVGSLYENYSFFPIEYQDNISTIKNSLSWSNGDLGHILMLQKATKILNRTDLDKEFIDRMGAFTLSRKNNLTTEIEHSDFEQGASGVAMMYKQLYKETFDEKYLSGYEFWKTETIQLLKNDILTNYYENNFDFLSGSLGVILTLNAFTEDNDSPWTDILMIK